MLLKRIAVTFPLLIIFATGFAKSPEHSAPHDTHHNMHESKTESNMEYEAANKKMHENMSITFSGDADIDFIKGMIPHHQGAIDMAKVVLKHGKNPKVNQLAKEIISAQTKEIEQMQSWLKEMEANK